MSLQGQLHGRRSTARRPGAAPLGLLTIYVVLLFGLPARLVFPGLGAAGRPADLLGLAMLLLWLLMRIRGGGRRGVNPVRVLLFIWIAVVGLAYAAGHARGLVPLEQRSTDRALLTACSSLGIALSVIELEPGPLRKLRMRVLVAAAGMALVGFVQYFLHFDVVPYIRVPLLVLNDDLTVITARGDVDLSRVPGTATHYIEFGCVLALVLPLAAAQLITARSDRERRQAKVCTALIGLAVPLSISRSAFVVLAVVALIGVLVWSVRHLLIAGAVTVVAAAGFQVVTPGLLGTIKALFLSVGADPSIAGRTQDYAIVSRYVRSRPLLGRGPGTFIPERYRVLDNDFLGILVQSGLIGLTAWCALFFGCYLVARRVVRLSDDLEVRHVGQALAAACIGIPAAMGTFDAFGFSTFAGISFLLFGTIGATYAHHKERPDVGLVPAPSGRNADGRRELSVVR